MPFTSTFRRATLPSDTTKPPPVNRQNVKQLSDTLDSLLGDKEIRLIQLKRAANENDPKLEITIQSFPLDSPTIPPFSALSYTWRSGSDTQDTAFVCYNDAFYEISWNLYLALGFLRHRQGDADLWLWVDQLCIRQDDPGEKSRQIPLMRGIYRRASGVVAWLGAEEEEEEEGGFLLPVLLRYLSWVVGEGVWDCGRFDLGDEMDFEGVGRDLGKGVRALVRFLAKPWFSRVWVVQEATSQRERLTLHFNEFSVPLSTLMTAVDHTNRLLIRANPSTSVTEDDGRITWFSFLWACPALCAVGGPGFETLQELMQKFCTWDCSLRSDKVYALLGLASDRQLYAAPDYSLTSEQVFRQVSATWMRHGIVNVLSSLTFAVAGRGRNGRVPSWVVDWSRFSSAHPVKPWRNNYKFAAGGPVDANAPYTFDGDRLALRGVVVDRVAAVARLCRPGAFARGDWTESALGLIREQRRSSSSLEQAEDEIERDLGRLLVLDGQSSLYELTGEEDEFSGQVISHDLAAFDVDHLRPVYSSHQVASWRDMPRAPYYKMSAEHLDAHFGSSSSWSDLLQMSDEAMDDFVSTRQRNTSAQAAYRDAIIAINMDQQLFRTEKGRLGIGKWGVRPEDEIVVLEGGRMPFVARREEGDLHGRRLVSEAYVRGIMHGEAIPDGSAWDTIEIV